MGTTSRNEFFCRISIQFILLVYKNFILQFRRPMGTISELFLPVISVVFVIILKNFLKFENKRHCFTTFEPDPLEINEQPALNNPLYSATLHIYYAPESPNTDAVMNIVRREISERYPINLRLESYATETGVLKGLQNLDRRTTRLNRCYVKGSGIIFNSLDENQLSYTIRLQHENGIMNSWNTLQKSPNFELPGPRTANMYLSEGFLHLQKFIGNAIIEWRVRKENLPYDFVQMYIQQLPYPEYSVDEFLAHVNLIIPLLFMLTFLYTAGIVVKELVLEKETRIRESMLMMGLKQWILWAAWYTKQFLFLIPTVMVLTFLMKFFVFTKSDWFLIFIFLILYVASMISFSFFVSVWINSAHLGLIVGFISWFGSFCPFLYLLFYYRSIAFGYVVTSCLLSNTAFGFGVEIVARLEQQAVGLLRSNVAEPITTDETLTMASVLLMLLLDSVLYLILTWYVNEVKPGQYGVPKPFYFPFLPSYWCNLQQSVSEANKLEMMQSLEYEDPSAHERVIGKPTVGVRIRNLTKVYGAWYTKYGRRKKALNKLNLDVYKGQITALLGHNGAGKTTTMSILTGLYTPTVGSAVINGYNILTDMDLIRDHIGICPQHNVLFNRLTVREHLSFFMLLKGIYNRSLIKAEVDKMIGNLLLSNKADVQVGCLSGGMKRKLSVGIALIGGSEIVFLDEPTAGMDPYARRATWDLLNQYKPGCCILMSTHLMDEADLLGDRIAIMAKGKIFCSGSSLFLKNRYGVGYHMTLVKEPHCASAEVETVVKTCVASARKLTDVGLEMTFILPSSDTNKFPELFEKLESAKNSLGISSYGISVTTMEEVFLKVREGNVQQESSSDKCLSNEYQQQNESQHECQHEESESGCVLEGSNNKKQFIPKGEELHLNPSCMGHNEPVVGKAPLTKESMNSDEQSSDPHVTNSNVSPGKKDARLFQTDKHTIIFNGENSSSKFPCLRTKSFPVVRTETRNKNMSPANVDLNRRNTIILPHIETSLNMDYNSGPGCIKPRVQPLPPISTAGMEGFMKREHELSIIHNSSCCSHNLDKEMSFQYQPNSGTLLWVQQFRAMFIKRFYYHIRFYPSLAVQLIFPVLFAALGLFVVLSFPNQDDPPRALHISNSVLDSKNTTIFYAELDGKTMNFSNFTAQDLSVTNFIDITEKVNKLRDSVQTINDTNQCCNYKYQLLDKFCASRNAIDLEYCRYKNSSFGYSHCITCLKCCSALKKLQSCSYFFTRSYPPPLDYCPSPPSLGLFAEPTGPLDNTNTFIREYILRLASKIGALSFYRIFQAGFTIAAEDPLISTCDCTKVNGKSVRGCSIMESLQQDPDSSTCVSLRYNEQIISPLRLFNESICKREPTCYRAEFTSLEYLEIYACINEEIGCKINSSLKTTFDLDFSSSSNRRSVSRVHPNSLPRTAVTIWYNNELYHTAAAAFNTYQSLLLKKMTRNKNLSMIVTNHPLPHNPEIVAVDVTRDFTGFGLSVLTLFGYSFFLANFAVFFVKEKESKAKHIQFVSGVSATSYWLSAFVLDLLNSCVPVFLTVIVFRMFPVDAYHGTALYSLFLILLLTCWAGIPFTYVLSFPFRNSLAAFAALLVVFFFISVFLIASVFLIQQFGKGNKDTISDSLHYAFLLSPTYGLASTLNDIYINQRVMEFCQQNYNICSYLSLNYTESTLIFERPGIGVTCVFLITEGVIFISLTILLERNFFMTSMKRLLQKNTTNKSKVITKGLEEDEDVYAEREKVMNCDTGTAVVLIKNLVKVYHNGIFGCTFQRDKRAVDDICLGISRGECFGLLGVNGAGKTTAFNVLTGDIPMTSGSASISCNDIQTSLCKARQMLGYCPQFDCLIDCMSAYELLWMYARLRGIPEKHIDGMVDIELRRLDLLKFAHKKCKKYSGGTKRKLSTAIALIGSPLVVFLDEPTNGMDPKTRRYVWDVLTKMVSKGKVIVLSSHSMEECEALCTRLAIMVNGQFKCLGSTQHLKNKYGSGITLQAKVKYELTDGIHDDRLNRCQSGIEETNKKSISQKSKFFSSQYSKSLSDSQVNNPPVSKSTSASQATIDSNVWHTSALHSFIKATFKGAELIEQHLGAVTYWLPSAAISWASIFRSLEESKEDLGIVDYSVSQTTLEQVFIKFAKEQKE